jgi:twinkle protein
VLTWVQSHFDWLEPEKPTLSHLLDVAKRLVLRRGVRGIVLDPWNEIEHARPHHMSETEYIGNCLREIRRFARGHQVHAWIVAHPRILQKDQKTGQYPVAGPYEISGSANWNNKPDAVISVWRERGQVFNPEVEIHIQKIRSKYVGQLGMARLHWNKVNGRYFDPFAAEQYEFKGEAQ